MITAEKRYYYKIEKYLKNYYKSINPANLTISLIVFPEEQESMVALRHMHQLIRSDLIVIEGRVICDIPLDHLL